MSESEDLKPTASLYGDEAALPVPEPPPGLGVQLSGLFTEPGLLFDRLRLRPVWGWAFGLGLFVTTLLTFVWALRVDADAMLRPILEANPQIPAERIDGIIAMQGKLMVAFGPIQAAFVVGISGLLVALVLWLIGKGFAEEGAPSFRQAFTAGQVVGLVMVPHSLAILLITLVKEVGGRTPDKLAPTSLGYYWLVEEQPKLQALLNALDPFLVAYFALLFLAGRRLLRLSVRGAGLATGALVLFMVGVRILFAR